MINTKSDIWSLFYQMYRSRIFEELVAKLWYKGLICGEMHLGMGEEAICAGVESYLQEGDALALDLRGQPDRSCGLIWARCNRNRWLGRGIGGTRSK